jgi:hypothetical protein
MSFGSASLYDSPNNELQPLRAMPLHSFLVMEGQYFAAVSLHRNMSDVCFDDLTTVMLNFFSQYRLGAK